MIKGYILFLYSDMECYIKKAIAIRIKGIEEAYKEGEIYTYNYMYIFYV